MSNVDEMRRGDGPAVNTEGKFCRATISPAEIIQTVNERVERETMAHLRMLRDLPAVDHDILEIARSNFAVAFMAMKQGTENIKHHRF